MKKENFFELESNGLQLIETTGGSNGYPEALRYGLIGFDTIEEAHELANAHGLEVLYVKKRDGWQLWERGGKAYEAYTICAEIYGDDYKSFRAGDEEDFFEDAIKWALEVAEDFADAQRIMKAGEKVIDAINLLDDNEQVITKGVDFVEVAKTETLDYSFDSCRHAIAVVNLFPTQEEDDE